MRRRSIFPGVFISTLCLIWATSAFALTPANLWSQRFGGTSSEIGYSVAVDGSGNVIVTGIFSGTSNFGGSDLVSAGLGDIFIAKYNASGVHQWSQRFGGPGVDYGSPVAVDGSGNVLVTGYFNGTANFGGSDLVSAGGSDMFLAKYNANGAHQWSQRFGDTSTDGGHLVAVDGSGNVLVTGYFNGTANFGGSDLVSAGGSDMFLAKYNANGAHQWSQRSGGTVNDAGYSVALDGSGNVLVTGYFNGTANFGGADLVSAGASDMFLAKYNANGAHQWSQRFGGTNIDNSYSVAVDGSGGAVVVGAFSGTSNFGGSDLVSAGNYDIFLAKYNVAGVHQWSQRFGSTFSDYGYSTTVDGSGNVFVTGYFIGTANFGGGDLVSAGGADIFLAKYSANGAHQWSQRFGGTSADYARSASVDGSGGVVMTGDFQGTANLGGSNLVSAGSDDIFVAKFAANPAEPVITSIADVRNDQGHKVRIQFASSGEDATAPTPILQYEVYRRNDALTLTTWPPVSSLSSSQLLDQGWVYAGTTPAHGKSAYLVDAPTDADSTIALGQHYSIFFVRAATASPLIFFDSPIDSGYSLDNLAPGRPGGLMYSMGHMLWNESAEEDFKHFTVYGANTNSFGEATLIDYAVMARIDVSASPYVFYFVTATDFSGNEGKPAIINTLTGVSGTPANFVLSISAYPNPFNPTTTIRYTIPSKGRVSVSVYDARGARIATLVNEDKLVGAYTQAWSGRDNAGQAVSSGVYFARVTHPQGVRSYKMVLLK